jgi:hypothetical protein
LNDSLLTGGLNGCSRIWLKVNAELTRTAAMSCPGIAKLSDLLYHPQIISICIQYASFYKIISKTLFA